MSGPARIAAIQQREQQATKGPWRIVHDTNIFADIDNYGKRLVANSGGHYSNLYDTNAENESNAAFIAHARADIPYLLHALQQAQTRLSLLQSSQAQGWQPMDELRTYLDGLTITGDNIGDIRRSLFMPFDSAWNGIVRDETAKREQATP